MWDKGVFAHEPNNQKENARSEQSNRLLPGWRPLLVVLLLTAVPPNQAIARSPHKSGPLPPLGIVVLLYNQAQVQADILQRAEGEVAQIVRPAGIDMSFVDCPITRERGPKYLACQEAAGSRFMVKIITLGTANHIPALSDGFGLALACGPGEGPCMAYVFSDRILQLTRSTNVVPSLVLGLVLSHEIGHMLGMAHSAEGLMRAEWNPSDFDPFNFSHVRFTAWQCQEIRARAAWFAKARGN